MFVCRGVGEFVAVSTGVLGDFRHRESESELNDIKIGACVIVFRFA